MSNQKRDPKTDPRAALGEALRQLRVDAGYTQAAAAALIDGWGEDSLQKAETGGQVPTDDFYARLLTLYAVTPREKVLLDVMLLTARAARGKVPEFFEVYLGREKQAEYLLLWCPVVVSGLLQVFEYARAMYTKAGLDEDEIEENVTARINRQAILDHPDAPHVTMLLHESVLRRLVGTPEVMVKQLTRLLEVSKWRNIIIQVIRDDGYFLGLEGQFEIASGDEIPDTVVMVAVEDQTLDGKAVVRKATTLFRKIQGRALTTEETQALITEAIEQWNSQQQ
jgi:transcriptional regulator with XRE-family HTH domain